MAQDLQQVFTNPEYFCHICILTQTLSLESCVWRGKQELVVVAAMRHKKLFKIQVLSGFTFYMESGCPFFGSSSVDFNVN